MAMNDSTTTIPSEIVIIAGKDCKSASRGGSNGEWGVCDDPVADMLRKIKIG